MLGSIGAAGAADWSVLIMDPVSTRVMSHACQISEILDYGISCKTRISFCSFAHLTVLQAFNAQLIDHWELLLLQWLKTLRRKESLCCPSLGCTSSLQQTGVCSVCWTTGKSDPCTRQPMSSSHPKCHQCTCKSSKIAQA